MRPPSSSSNNTNNLKTQASIPLCSSNNSSNSISNNKSSQTIRELDSVQPQQNQPQPQYSFQSLSSIPQNGVPDFSQQQQYQAPVQHMQPQQTSSNPFRQTPTGLSQGPISPVSPSNQMRQSTNPFAKHNDTTSPVSALQQDNHMVDHSSFLQNSTSPPPQQNQSPAALQPQRTGTNPFAKSLSPPPSQQPLTMNVTGTNPFRQSQFVNQTTGMGWQHSTQQGTFGGFDVNNVPTQPVFPRPGANSS
jgi:phosphatidylinositol-binding clathrin assembly protein